MDLKAARLIVELIPALEARSPYEAIHDIVEAALGRVRNDTLEEAVSAIEKAYGVPREAYGNGSIAETANNIDIIRALKSEASDD